MGSEAVGQGTAAYRGSGATGHINNAQAYQEGGRQTRKTRGGQQLSNDDVKKLQETLQTLNAQLLAENDPAKRKIILENIKEIKSQLAAARGHTVEMATVQGGTAAGGGGVMANNTKNAFTSGAGSGSGSGEGGGAATTTGSDGL